MEYKRVRNAVKQLHTEKNNFILNEFINKRNDIKGTWKLINNVLGRKSILQKT